MLVLSTSKIIANIICTYAGIIEQYIRHPETKSLGPDGKPCTAETRGLLQRAHITAGRIRYIDKESSPLWNHGDDLSVLTDYDEAGFRVTEYGRGRKIVVSDNVRNEIRTIGIKKYARESGIHRSVIRKIERGEPVKHKTCKKVIQWLHDYQTLGTARFAAHAGSPEVSPGGYPERRGRHLIRS